MNRREFLGLAAAGAASFAFPNIVRDTTKPKMKIERLATDHFEIVMDHPERFRMLQLTDTHFGNPGDAKELTDKRSVIMIKRLVEEQAPDFVFHTGDFINNDKENSEHATGLGLMNDLGTPWSLVWGNHDHADGQVGGLALDAYYSRLQNHAMGYVEAEGQRHYCFRIDIRAPKSKPFASLVGFNCGGLDNAKVITPAQLAWFRHQLESDRRKGLRHPILVMQHIPTIEYKTLYDGQEAIGRRGEAVCYEQDHGDPFALYAASGRVKGVFCGHDHVNDYSGVLQGVRLNYGRVSGWSGYGDWQRGGRLIELNETPNAFQTRVVLPSRSNEKPEWSTTLTPVP